MPTPPQVAGPPRGPTGTHGMMSPWSWRHPELLLPIFFFLLTVVSLLGLSFSDCILQNRFHGKASEWGKREAFCALSRAGLAVWRSAR